MGKILAAAACLAAVLAVRPPAEAAASYQAGDLVKAPDSRAVYYVGSDGRRYVFPNQLTYLTWYGDFASVRTIADAELAALSIGGNVTYRPGTRLVKIVSDPRVYAVEPGGVLRPIPDESAAVALYGADWSKRVDDVPDAFFFSYRIGAPLAAAAYPEGSWVRRVSDGRIFLIQDGQKREVSGSLLTALRVTAAQIMPETADLNGYALGAPLEQTESLNDTAQLGIERTTAAPVASLYLQPATDPGMPIYVRGTKDAAIAGLLLMDGSADPVTVSAITFQGYVDSEGTAGFLPAVDSDGGSAKHVNAILPAASLYDDTGRLLAGPVPIGLDGRAFFSGFRLAVPAGGSRTVVIRGDIPAYLDTGLEPDYLAFDVEDAVRDVTVTDAAGGSVKATGNRPNRGTEAFNYAKILRSGTVNFTWRGTTTVMIGGRDAKLGTLTVDTKYDTYALRTIAFRRTSQTSYGDARLEYPGADGKTVSKTVQWRGGAAVFTDLGAYLPRDSSVGLALYAQVLSRDTGGVYGDALGAQLDTAGPLQFVSQAEGATYSEKDLGNGSFGLVANTAGRVTVRYSGLSVTPLPTAVAFRDSNTPLLAFSAKAEPEGPIRIRKMTFRISPDDAGRSGAANDALELWAGRPATSIAAVRRVYSTTTELLGTPGNGRLRFREWRGNGTEIDQAQPFQSNIGDYATLELDFGENGEYLIPAGLTADFRFELDTTVFPTDRDHRCAVELRGDADFLWTDIPYGAYTALGGTDAGGVPFSATVTVNK